MKGRKGEKGIVWHSWNNGINYWDEYTFRHSVLCLELMNAWLDCCAANCLRVGNSSQEQISQLVGQLLKMQISRVISHIQSTFVLLEVISSYQKLHITSSGAAYINI